jgi:hypothetical protein
VEMLTTVGSSLLARSAKESGAGRANAGVAATSARMANRSLALACPFRDG